MAHMHLVVLIENIINLYSSLTSEVDRDDVCLLNLPKRRLRHSIYVPTSIDLFIKRPAYSSLSLSCFINFGLIFHKFLLPLPINLGGSSTTTSG